VLGSMPVEASQVIRNVGNSLSVPMIQHGVDFRVTHEANGEFGYDGSRWHWQGLRTNLLGRHQVSNAANALALLEVATPRQFPVKESAVREGLQHVKWPGRLDIVGHDPLTVIDGAHNPSAAMALFDFLQLQLHDAPDRKLIMVIGMMQDKDHAGFLRRLHPISDYLILTQPHLERAASPEILAAALEAGGRPPLLIADPKDALEHAKGLARPVDLICVTGSLFLVGEIAGYFSLSGAPTVQV